MNYEEEEEEENRFLVKNSVKKVADFSIPVLERRSVNFIKSLTSCFEFSKS